MGGSGATPRLRSAPSASRKTPTMTTQLAARQDTYRTAFDQLQQDRPGPTAFGALRARGFARFSEVGFPTTRLEVVALHQCRSRDAASVRGSGADGPPPVRHLGVRADRRRRAHKSSVSMVDMHPISRVSASYQRALKLGSLADVLVTDPQLADQHLAQLARFDDPAASFTALNTGFLQDGLVVRIPDHTVSRGAGPPALRQHRWRRRDESSSHLGRGRREQPGAVGRELCRSPPTVRISRTP